MKCTHCFERIPRKHPYVSIEWNDPSSRRGGQPRASIGEFLYHAVCFGEIAGKGYKNELAASYYNGHEAQNPYSKTYREHKERVIERIKNDFWLK